jgi:WD40 repeat protein
VLLTLGLSLLLVQLTEAQVLVRKPIHDQPGIKDRNPAPSAEAMQPREKARMSHAGKMVIGVAFASDGKLVASGGWDNLVRLWDPETGKEIHQLAGHSAAVFSVTFSPDGKIVASGSDDRSIRLWDPHTGKLIKQLAGHQNGVTRVAFSPDGESLVSGSYDGTARLWEVKTGKSKVIGTPGGQTTYAVAFAPDGRFIAIGRADGTIDIHDPATGKHLRRMEQTLGNVWYLSFSPDSRTLASGQQSGSNACLNLWEVGTGKQRGIAGQPGVCGVVFSPDGRTLATGSGSGTVQLWEAATGKERCRLGQHKGVVPTVAFGAEGRTVASVGHDGTVRIWDTASMGDDLRAEKVGAGESGPLWADLASDDAAKAYRAICLLGRSPEVALPLLAKNVRPAPWARTSAQRITGLIADLDDDSFTVREKASSELERLGSVAGPALQKARQSKPSPEMRRRLDQLLEHLEGIRLTPDEVRGLRSVEILEHIGTAEARRLLQALAEGAPEAALTQEAKTTLLRLSRRLATP